MAQPPASTPIGMESVTENTAPSKRQKASYVGAPAIFALNLCCQQINAAFGLFGCYLVGSAIERPDWRDVDVRFILSDEEFSNLFPDAVTTSAAWEHDPRWAILNTGISWWLRNATGLPVDFQFQPQTWANERHNKMRHALGMQVVREAE